MEDKKTNIYQKLQKCRVEIQKKNLSQSGINNYSNYKYFELGDFLPYINEICDKYGLCNIFQFTKESAHLIVVNTDNPDETLDFSTPVDIPQLKGCSMLQNLGGAQTFTRRYLYMMAYEISDYDSVNNGVDEEAELKKQKISKSKVVVINKLLDETESDRTKFLKVCNIDKVENITEEMFSQVLKMLSDKKDKIEKKKAAEAAAKSKGGAF